MNDVEVQVRERIEAMGFTQAQLDFIFADWPNWNDHLAWLLSASKSEILAWIKAGGA